MSHHSPAAPVAAVPGRRARCTAVEDDTEADDDGQDGDDRRDDAPPLRGREGQRSGKQEEVRDARRPGRESRGRPDERAPDDAEEAGDPQRGGAQEYVVRAAHDEQSDAPVALVERSRERLPPGTDEDERPSGQQQRAGDIPQPSDNSGDMTRPSVGTRSVAGRTL